MDGGARARAETESRAQGHGLADDPYGGDADDVDDIEELGDWIATLAAHVHAAEHRLLVLIAEFDLRRGWELDGHRSCAHWLAFRTGIELVTAREKVRVARALRDLPQTDQAMSRGELSFAKVRALTRAASASNEGELLAFARDTTAAQLERTVRSMKLLSRRDEVERERERHRWRSFSVFPDGTGMYEVRGRLDPEVAAVLMRAIEAASDALHGSACDVEEVEPQQRRADAVGLVAERVLAAGFGEVTIERGQAGQYESTHADRSENGHTHRSEGGHASPSESRHTGPSERRHGRPGNGQASRPESGYTGRGDHEGAGASERLRRRPRAPVRDATHQHGRGQSASAPSAIHRVDARVSAEAPDMLAAVDARESGSASAEVRHIPPTTEATAVASSAEGAHAGSTAGASRGLERSSAEEFHSMLSGSRAERYQVVIHVDIDTLRSDVESGRCELADGTRLSPETARRLSCDAGVVRVTRDRHSPILDVGRRTRTIPPALRRALEIRDGGCRFPGCGSRFVEAHHILHWADGGKTSLANCCLLCRWHHRLVHEEGYRIEFTPGGEPTFYTPKGLPVPDKPPRLPEATLEALMRASLRRGVSPDGWTCTARYAREADIPWSVLAKVLDAIDA